MKIHVFFLCYVFLSFFGYAQEAAQMKHPKKGFLYFDFSQDFPDNLKKQYMDYTHYFFLRCIELDNSFERVYTNSYFQVAIGNSIKDVAKKHNIPEEMLNSSSSIFTASKYYDEKEKILFFLLVLTSENFESAHTLFQALNRHFQYCVLMYLKEKEPQHEIVKNLDVHDLNDFQIALLTRSKKTLKEYCDRIIKEGKASPQEIIEFLNLQHFEKEELTSWNQRKERTTQDKKKDNE